LHGNDRGGPDQIGTSGRDDERFTWLPLLVLSALDGP